MKNTTQLNLGTRVKIKSKPNDYGFEAGTIKTITKHLPDFGKSKAYCLDNDEGIWCNEDFEIVVETSENASAI